MRIVLDALLVLTIMLACSSGVSAQEKKKQPAAKKPAAAKAETETTDKPAGDKSEDGKQGPKKTPADNSTAADPASQLIKKSVWRGDRWRGQNQNSIVGPQPSDEVKVTMRDGNQVTLTGKKWEGALGKVHWTFTIDGDKLTCTHVSFEGGGPTGTFTEVSGSGTIKGDILQFECAAHQKSPNFDGMIYEKLQLKRGP